MKRRIALLVVFLVIFIAVPSFAQTVLKVGATPMPHGEILELIAPLLAEQGIILEIIEFTDYIRPNRALYERELDANFFQHTPYLEGFNRDAGTDLVPSVGVFIAPLGVYSEKIASLDELPRNGKIAIPNDATNGGRALLLLQTAGVLKVDPDAADPTVFDIVENPFNIKIHELEAPQLSLSLPDVHAAIINGTFALEAGLDPVGDSILLEGGESYYVNILAVRSDNAADPAIQKLAETLQSDLVRDFITERYQGSFIATF